jgi:DnaJ domain
MPVRSRRRAGIAFTGLCRPVGGRLLGGFGREIWCPGRDLNPHAFRQRCLRPSCLPFHHLGGSVTEVSPPRAAPRTTFREKLKLVKGADGANALDIAEARQTLGVTASSSIDEIRTAYRARLRQVHPDQNTRSSATAETKQLIAAFRLATDVQGWAEPEPVSPEPVVSSQSTDEPAAFAAVIDDDTVAIAATGTEAFAALVAVGHEIGDVTYIDRQNELLEILLRTVTNDTLSLVATLQGRANGTTEAFLTLEPLDVGVTELPTIRGVALLVAHHLNYQHAFSH